MDSVARGLAQRWGFVPTEELPGGHCSRVYANSELVLKVPWQGEEMDSGFGAALAMSRTIGPRIYESDVDTGSLLMDRIHPGTSLAECLDDQSCMEVAIGLMRQMWDLDPAGFLNLSKFYSYPHPLLDKLLAGTARTVPLHGDLHHYNILRRGQDKFVAIDPKGLIGDPAYEVIAFLRNPIDRLGEGPTLLNQTRHRILHFAKHLRLDPWRIAAWSLVDLDEPGNDRSPDDPWSRLHKAVLQLERELS